MAKKKIKPLPLLPEKADDHTDNDSLDFNEETGAYLLQIQDNLNEVLSLYCFHCFACQELAANMPELHDGKFLLGLMLTRHWLEKRGDKLMRKIDRMRESVAGRG